MAFIKNHLISLLCGAGALAFIVIGVRGMMSDAVVTEMNKLASKKHEISQLRSSAKNDKSIQAEAERGQSFEKEYNDTLAVAKRINERKVLKDGVFPSTERLAVRAEYRDRYKRAIMQLPRGKLAGGDLPNEHEIEEARINLAELEAQREEEAAEGRTARPIGERTSARGYVARNTRRSPGGAGPYSSRSTAGDGLFVSGGAGGGGRTSALGGSPAGDPDTDPVARAAVIKARSIRCYVGSDPARSSFHISPIWDDTRLPTPEEMWYAQVGLWVQQDVVDAIADLNEQAARQLKEDERCVEKMPVKRLEMIHVLGYWTKDGQIPFPVLDGGPATSVKPMEMQTAFTGRTCNAQFDVIRFQVVAVVDQRALLKLINAITQENFYKLLSVSCHTITDEDSDYRQGYFYGTAPVVRANLEFEGYLARNVYEQLLPAEVRELLGIKGGK